MKNTKELGKEGGGHVVAVAFPFGTHAAPLLVVVRRLASASPNTKFSFISINTNTTITENQDNIRGYSVWDGVDHGKPKPESEPERIKLFMSVAPQSLRQAVDAAETEAGRKVSCLVTDAFYWFGGQMAQDIGVPWLPFWTASPTSLVAHMYTDVIRDKLSSSSSSGTSNNLIQPDLKLSSIPGMSKLCAQDLPQGIVFGDLDSFFSHMLRDMGIMLPQATTLLLNSFPGLDDKDILQLLKSKFNNLFLLGPLNLVAPPPPTSHDENSCLAWLDAQDKPSSVAYIALGSVAVPSTEELVAIAQGLEASGVPFIWSLRDNAKANLPQGFMDRTLKQGRLLHWAPQTEILSHRAVGVFVTHGGWNSLLESIAGGVPMICRPFFGDQMLNVRMIQDVWEVGVIVEGGDFTKEGVVKCLDLVLTQEKGKSMKEKIKTLRDLAMEAVGSKGSSTESLKLLEDMVTTATTPA